MMYFKIPRFKLECSRLWLRIYFYKLETENLIDAKHFDFGEIEILAGEDWMYSIAKNPDQEEKILPRYIEIEWLNDN